jgi:hypothetical protein
MGDDVLAHKCRHTYYEKCIKDAFENVEEI